MAFSFTLLTWQFKKLDVLYGYLSVYALPPPTLSLGASLVNENLKIQSPLVKSSQGRAHFMALVLIILAFIQQTLHSANLKSPLCARTCSRHSRGEPPWWWDGLYLVRLPKVLTLLWQAENASQRISIFKSLEAANEPYCANTMIKLRILREGIHPGLSSGP